MSSYLTFRMGARVLAAPLDQVREVVRAVGVETLAGVRAPVTGLLELRGDPLPVVDLRTMHDEDELGDVIVVVPIEEGPLGLAVDKVVAVVTSELPRNAGGKLLKGKLRGQVQWGPALR